MSVEYNKPDLEVRAFYFWEEVENWLDSSFIDSMYVVDAWKEIVFDAKTGFQFIDFSYNYKFDEQEDKRLNKLHGYLTKCLGHNESGIWVYLV